MGANEELSLKATLVRTYTLLTHSDDDARRVEPRLCGSPPVESSSAMLF